MLGLGQGLSGLKSPPWSPWSLLSGAATPSALGAGGWPGDQQGEAEEGRGQQIPPGPTCSLACSLVIPPGPGAGGPRTPIPTLTGAPLWAEGGSRDAPVLSLSPEGGPLCPQRTGSHNSPEAWHSRGRQALGDLRAPIKPSQSSHKRRLIFDDLKGLVQRGSVSGGRRRGDT